MTMTHPEPSTTDLRRSWTAFGVLALPLLLVSMDVSILYFAVPQISEDLHASATQQLWIFDVYGFVLAGLLVTMGAVADRIGARRLLLIGAVAFSATSVGAAVSQTPEQLIAARAVLGLAGATLMPSTLSMVRTLFPDDRERSRAVAAWTGIMTAGVALGPVLSGVLLEHFAWGSVFLVNLPAMTLLVVAGPMLLPRTPGRPGTRFDLLGSGLSLGAVLPTVYGVKQWAAEGFSPVRLGAIVVGIVLGVLFVLRQRTADAPMIDPRLLRSRAYLAAVGGNLACSFALIGNAVFMTAYLQLVLGYSPFVSALWSLAPALAVGAVAPAAPVFAERFGRARAAGIGLTAGVVGFAIIASHDALATILVGAGVLAAGSVVTMTICSDAVLAALDPSEAGAGAALAEAAQELGGALGIAVLGSVAAVAYRSDAAAHLPSGTSDGPAGDSLAGAVGLAASLPDRLAGPVVDAARHAFIQGLDAAAVTGAALLAVAAVLAFSGGRRGPSAPATPDPRR